MGMFYTPISIGDRHIKTRLKDKEGFAMAHCFNDSFTLSHDKKA